MDPVTLDGFFGMLPTMNQEDLDAIESALDPMAVEMQIPATDTALDKADMHNLTAAQQSYNQQAHSQQQAQVYQPSQKHPHPYPTPNSTSMSAAAAKPYMSPFPEPGSAAALALSQEIDDILFTPMMSPAMTPMHHAFPPQQQDVDWDCFDQSMFALTGPAMSGQVHTPTMELDQAAMLGLTSPVQTLPQQQQSTLPPLAKRQRLARKPSSQSMTGKSPALNAIKHRRKTVSMSAPLLRKGPLSLEPSPEPTGMRGDSVSPMSAEHNTSGSVKANSTVTAQECFDQPITPSMLMALSGTLRETGDAIPTSAPNQIARTADSTTTSRFPAPIVTTSLSSSTFRSPSQPNTPATSVPTSRPSNSGGLPIMPKKAASVTHSRAGSVHNSPALGPSHPRNSPDLRPILPGGMSPQVSALLASKSNYQHILDGTLNQMGVSYPTGMTAGLENRRTSHKQAEQKRRDHLKESFELLRNILPDKLDASASKVMLLRKGYEYIVACQKQVEEKNAEIARLRKMAGLSEPSNDALQSSSQEASESSDDSRRKTSDSEASPSDYKQDKE